MNPELYHISEKINSVQSAILRFHNKSERMVLEVRVVSGENATLNCVITDDLPLSKLVNRKVSVIQRYKDDYLYVAGKVIFVGEQHRGVVSISIDRAFWFIRRIKGHVTWLENKYVYENSDRNRA